MDRSSLAYDLPRELIAQEPELRRDEARLLVLERPSGRLSHRRFRELPDLLSPGDLVVVNDSRVLPARLSGERATGGKLRVLLVREITAGKWRVLVESRRRILPGEPVFFAGRMVRAALTRVPKAQWEKVPGNGWVLDFGPANVRSLLERWGRMPLPPYIRRQRETDPRDDVDRERYQTVYARSAGSIAAPTAGLHFTPEVFAALKDKGISVARVTLHVGTGTFLPIRAEKIEEHRMEPEPYWTPEETVRCIEKALREGKRIIAVGTTVCRVLESYARHGPPGLEGAWSDLFIYPPFEFQIVSALVTNFHLPEGTPLALAAAFAGLQRVLAAYEEARRLGYRFFSYGDAMLIL